MKIIKLCAFFLIISAMQLPAMEEVREIEEPISPFNYFDKEGCIVEASFGFLFVEVYARHLPTMRNYFAYTDGPNIKGHYQTKNTDKQIDLDESKANAVFSTLSKISPKTPPSEKKNLLDQLHATLDTSAKSKLLELHPTQENPDN